jgi:hypothetical protein
MPTIRLGSTRNNGSPMPVCGCLGLDGTCYDVVTQGAREHTRKRGQRSRYSPRA